MTQRDVQKMMQRAEDMAGTMFYGMKKDAQGKLVPASQVPGFDPQDQSTWGVDKNGDPMTMNYTQALRKMLRSGIKEGVARSSLNALYDRGSAGRPYFSQVEKRAVLKKLGRVHYTGLLNTLHRFYTNYISEYQNGNQDNATGWKHQFDQLVRGTLASVGMA